MNKLSVCIVTSALGVRAAFAAEASAAPARPALPAVTATAPAGQPVTRLIMLGTQGGPRVQVSRAQPATLLIVNGTNYLFDAGNGVSRQLALAGVPNVAIGRIFITHNHDDHSADWGTMMGLAWSMGRKEPIHVYGPRGTESMLLGFLQFFGPNVANRTFKNAGATDPKTVFFAHDIQQAGAVYEDPNVKVTALENCHFHYGPGDPAYGWQQSLSYRIQTPDRVIVISGDTGECGQKLVDFARDASALVHEVVLSDVIERQLRGDPAIRYNGKQIDDLMQHMREEHTAPEDIGRLAAAAHVKQVVLTHLVPGGDVAPDTAYSDGVRKFYSGPVVVAKDLMEFR